jgi:hypothetical protein
MTTIPAARNTAKCLEIVVGGRRRRWAISLTMSGSPRLSSARIAQRFGSFNAAATGASGNNGGCCRTVGEEGVVFIGLIQICTREIVTLRKIITALRNAMASLRNAITPNRNAIAANRKCIAAVRNSLESLKYDITAIRNAIAPHRKCLTALRNYIAANGNWIAA